MMVVGPMAVTLDQRIAFRRPEILADHFPETSSLKVTFGAQPSFLLASGSRRPATFRLQSDGNSASTATMLFRPRLPFLPLALAFPAY